jgi:hypothetical protein
MSGTVTDMETTPPQKLYAYVDESGQDTAGRFFVVSVVLFGTDCDTVLARLEALEARSGKGLHKDSRNNRHSLSAHCNCAVLGL